MKYFENFPKTIYTFDKNTINPQAVTNILARSTFLRDIKDNVNLSYEYLVRDEDNPETIAHKAYGDPYRSWIVLLFNNILDPNYDWPLKTPVLDTYIENKYNMTVQEAKSTIHHYEKETKIVSIYNGVLLNETVDVSEISEYQVNPNTNALTPNPLPNIADTSIAIGSKTSSYPTYELTTNVYHKAVSIYTYEFEENEKKRKIRVLDPRFVQRVENEFRELMLNG